MQSDEKVSSKGGVSTLYKPSLGARPLSQRGRGKRERGLETLAALGFFHLWGA